MEIRVFPSDDLEFARAVEEALATAGGPDTAEAEQDGLRELVAGILRQRYPQLAIGTQSELASLGGAPRRWYVYRDGRIASQSVSDEPASRRTGGLIGKEPASG